MKGLFCVLLVLVASLAMGVQGQAGPYRFRLVTEPAVVPVGKAKIRIELTDAQGAEVVGATVKVLAKMPSMNMGEREELASASDESGTYLAPAVFSMAGAYEVKVSVQGKQGSGQGSVPLATGSKSDEAPTPFPSWLPGLVVGVAGVGAILWRMRATGQRVELAGLLDRRALLSLGLIVVCLVAAVWAVRNLRREGAMTPLEAQVMEMNTPAPEGTVPVHLALVAQEEFVETITYSGQVSGFVDQEVVPRVGGKILRMEVYVGDRVRKGQLLAKLDTSQTDPMVSEAAAGADVAREGVGMALADHGMAQNMEREAGAEVQMAKSELAEGRAMIDAARAGQATSAAEVDSADAELTAAKAEVASAQADATYQGQEIDRAKALYAQGALSKAEWQSAEAEAQKAVAGLRVARGNQAKAEAMLRAARAQATRGQAEVRAAATRLEKAEANLRAKRAQSQVAAGRVRSAKARLAMSRAEVGEKVAGLTSARTQRGYSELRAEVDGVVTERLVSPGVVVAPGQAVLRVSQVKPIRVQANVPQQDLVRVQVGAGVVVRGPSGDLKLEVTSVSPSVDPASRLGKVEAVFANENGELVPGQFVSMTILAGRPSTELVIPTDSLADDSGGRFVVWVATSAAGGLTAERREVELVGRARERVAVRGKLAKGDHVVRAPAGLVAGQRLVANHAEATPATDHARVEVTEAGFVPAVVTLKADQSNKITFLRKTEATCGTEAEFKGISLRADLPLNQEVTVVIPPHPAGKALRYACKMDMIKGTVEFK